MPAKISLPNFTERANTCHKYKYLYPNVVLTNGVHTKIEIICPKHGAFLQKANDHLRGCGCYKCKPNYPLTPTEIINRSNLVHPNQYKYEELSIGNIMKKMKILCLKCNLIFYQTPNDHIKNQAGCPRCSNRMPVDISEFVRRSEPFHGKKYDYTQAICKGVHKKVNIICPTHGIFKQTMRNHMNGQGCPKCKMSSGESAIYNWLANNNIDFLYQHSFIDCISDKMKKLLFDFYIPASNILIEYDGEQHFHPVILFNQSISFERIILLDEIKTKYASDNNIKLIRISEKKISDITNILDKKIKEKQCIL